MSRSRRGLTLIEVLLVTALFASLGLAIFTCLTNGIKLWDRSNKLAAEEDLFFLFERFSVDATAAFPFSRIPVKGTEMSFVFPAPVLSQGAASALKGEDGFAERIGAVAYEYDPATRMVTRRTADYGQALKKDFNDPEVLAVGVEEFRLRYFYTGRREYSSSASGQELPSGVEMEVRLAGVDGGRILKRFVKIPSGG